MEKASAISNWPSKFQSATRASLKEQEAINFLEKKMKNDLEFSYDETLHVCFCLCFRKTTQVIEFLIESKIMHYITIVVHTAISDLQSILQEDFKANQIEVHPRKNVGIGKDHTIFTLIDGLLEFKKFEPYRKKTEISALQSVLQEDFKANQIEVHPRKNVGIGNDHIIFTLINGLMEFKKSKHHRRRCNIKLAFKASKCKAGLKEQDAINFLEKKMKNDHEFSYDETVQVHPRKNVGIGKDHTIFTLIDRLMIAGV
nr:50S ribosomal protein L27, chloroplastic [Tanacetum cinerariifolium]